MLLALGLIGARFAGTARPFVWGDVAAAHLLLAAPFAFVLVTTLGRRASDRACVVVGLAILGSALWVGTDSPPALRPAVRVVTAALLAVGALLTARPLLPTAPPPGRSTLAAGLLSLLTMVLPPLLYGEARARHETRRLGELIEQSRVGEAHRLAADLLSWDREGRHGGKPLRTVERELRLEVLSLRGRAARDLGPRPSAGERVGRARDLAMLGETSAALDVLSSLGGPELTPAVMNLVATIHEARGEWADAATWYGLASVAAARGSTDEDAAEALRALRGIGYSERKRGRLNEAEAAYLELLRQRPSAEHHFLLARFYEDSQQTSAAARHAHEAMLLDAASYGEVGRALIDELAVRHFGCFGVHAGRRRVVPP